MENNFDKQCGKIISKLAWENVYVNIVENILNPHSCFVRDKCWIFKDKNNLNHSEYPNKYDLIIIYTSKLLFAG